MALLASAGGAHAAPPDRPQSVGERFNWVNRPQALVVDGWEVRPSLTAGGGYDDNITLTGDDGPSSSELFLRAAMDAGRGIGAYWLTLNAAFGQTWYPEASENDATEANVRAAALYDAKPFTMHSAVSYLQGVEREIDNGIFVDGVFEPYTTRAEFRRVPFEAGFTYDIARVVFEGGLRVSAVDYETLTTTSGLSVPQDFRSGWEGEVRFRGGYEATPDLAFFAEAATATNQYRDSQGDSDTWRVVVGSAMEFTRLLIGEVSAGYGATSLNAGGETSGFTYRARLNWFVSELVSLTLNGERRFEAEVVTTSTGVTSAVPLTHDVINLRAEWEPLRRLYVHAQAGYEEERNESVSRIDDLTSINAGAAYVFDSSWRLAVDGTYEFGTSGFSSDVERHRVVLGLTAAF